MSIQQTPDILNINLISPHYNKISNGGRTFTIRKIKD